MQQLSPKLRLLLLWQKQNSPITISTAKSKYQSRMKNCINTIFEEIQMELHERQDKLNNALNMVNKREVLANILEIDTSCYTVEQVDKVLSKYMLTVIHY